MILIHISGWLDCIIFFFFIHYINLSKEKLSRKKGKKREYTVNDMLSAVAEIQDGTLKYREAANKYGVTIATLCDRIKRRVPLEPSRTGNVPVPHLIWI